MSTRRRLTALLAVPALLLAACGEDDAEEPAQQPPATTAAPATTSVAADEATFPVTITTDAGEVVLEAAPERIVSLSPTATEILFAIGAGEQVAAVDDYSNFPAEAPVTDLSAFTPNAEAVAGYDPDLVVVADDTNGIVDALEALEVPVMLLPAAEVLEDSYEQIEQLGTATGQADGAERVVEEMRTRIDAVVAEASGAPTDDPLTYYHELDPTYFSATSKTFIGDVYGRLGLENIADAADTDASGYPQLSGEYILEQDPDLIFLADTKCCAQTAETVATRAGWDQLQAVQRDAVVELDDDIASRWGPRVVELLEVVAERVQVLRP